MFSDLDWKDVQYDRWNCDSTSLQNMNMSLVKGTVTIKNGPFELALKSIIQCSSECSGSDADAL